MTMAMACHPSSIHIIPPLAPIVNPTTPSSEPPSRRRLLPEATVTHHHLLPFHPLRIHLSITPPLGSLPTTAQAVSHLGTDIRLCQKLLLPLLVLPRRLHLPLLVLIDHNNSSRPSRNPLGAPSLVLLTT